jgi:hypothetical protein
MTDEPRADQTDDLAGRPPASPEATTPPTASAGRRWLIRGCLILATVLAVVGIFAVWANRQALNSDNWADTSSRLLENAEIREQVSLVLVDTVYANVDVTQTLGEQLPPALKPLAAPVAGGLRQLAERATERTLERPRVQEAWKQANKITAEQFIAIAKDESRAITTQGDAVVLDLRPLVIQLVARLGLPGKVANQIPEGAGAVKIMDSDSVDALQNGAAALDGLATILPILALGLFALAVFLARSRRRSTLMWVGIDLIIAGLIVLIARRLAGGAVVEALASTESVKPATEAAWAIGTDMLRDVAGACVITGIPIVFAAWIAGPSRPAPAIRRWAAPWLIERPGIVYGILAAVLALIVIWQPIPATGKVIPVLLMIGLSILGVEVLRRQVAEEQASGAFAEASGPDPAAA